MKKVYKQPTIKVITIHPRTIMLATSQFPDKARVLDEEGDGNDYD